MLTSLQALLRLATLRWLGVFVCALATLLAAANTASAHEPTQTKTRVWGFDFAEHNSVGLFRAASSGKHQGNCSAGAEEASDSLLAARGAAGLAERAVAAGARYPKQVEQALRMARPQLQKSVTSFTENIAKHQGYLKNPQSHVPNWNQLSPQHQQNLIHHWNSDIARAQGYMDIAEGVLGGVLK